MKERGLDGRHQVERRGQAVVTLPEKKKARGWIGIGYVRMRIIG